MKRSQGEFVIEEEMKGGEMSEVIVDLEVTNIKGTKWCST